MEKVNWRKSDQYLMPFNKKASVKGMYDLYPTLKIEDGKIFEGFESLAKLIAGENQIIIDGYVGVFFTEFKDKLDVELIKLGKKVAWKLIDEAMKQEDEINRTIEPFLGGDDPIFGKRTTLNLIDFFDPNKLQGLKSDMGSDLNILIGCGAALAGWEGLLIYIDIPKSELQFRARAKSVTNLGASKAMDIKPMYKRYYFVDWVVLNPPLLPVRRKSGQQFNLS
ncbi:MAG: hypothetical protein NT144_09155 [Bacteroidia bacterium]|nr:hypothetical protein [Bacteroidia bacterium]